MMKKLYLIRRNLESFAGPMTLVDLKAEYKRMAFGLQDEISGHLGPWVSLDDLERLRRHYPEVGKVIHDEMFSGWGLGEATAQHMVTENKKGSQRQRKAPRRNLGLALACLIIAGFAFAAAVFLATTSKYSGKLVEPAESPQLIEIEGLVAKEDYGNAALVVERNLDRLVAEVGQSKAQLNKWLPYLRLYAFARTGEIEGVNQRYLRGPGATFSECSLDAWKKRWRQGMRQWADFAAGRELVKQHWARLLAFDPHWVRKREPRGWVKPKNFAVACLDQAYRAFEETLAEAAKDPTMPKTEEIAQLSRSIQRRLLWQLEMSRDGRSVITAAQDEKDDILTFMTCQERAEKETDLKLCRMVGGEAPDVVSYLEERGTWQRARVLARSTDPQVFEERGPIAQLLPSLSKTDLRDSFTRFDYKPEALFLRTMAKPGTTRSKAAEKVREEHVEVNFLQ